MPYTILCLCNTDLPLHEVNRGSSCHKVSFHGICYKNNYICINVIIVRDVVVNTEVGIVPNLFNIIN